MLFWCSNGGEHDRQAEGSGVSRRFPARQSDQEDPTRRRGHLAARARQQEHQARGDGSRLRRRREGRPQGLASQWLGVKLRP